VSDGEASRFAAEWRQDVMQQLREQGQFNQQMSKTLGDLATIVTTLKSSVDDMKKEPAAISSMFSSYGGCLGQLVFAGFAFLSFAVSVTAIVITLLR
jgi:hypothetical protein